MSLKNMMKKKVKFKKIASPSTEEYKKRQNSRSSIKLDDLLNAEGLIRADLES